MLSTYSRLAFLRMAVVAVGCAALAATMVGCDKGTGLTKVVVTGTITYNGEPIDNGEIRFLPIDATQGPISGGPIVKGTYKAVSKGGVPVGTHRVEIRGYMPAAVVTGSSTAAVEGGPAVQFVDKTFNDQSELTCKIDSSTTTKDFNLTTN